MASRSVEFDVGGFPAMATTMAQGDNPFQIVEGYVESPGNPNSPVVVRPAWIRLSATQMGTGSPAALEGLVYQFRKLDGTEKTILISRGTVYYVDSWSSPSVAEALSAAVLAAASVTIANSVIYACTFNNQVVISDGTNTPWMWDGTVGGGITKLTNAPVAYGPPTVYYARLFFIKNTDRGAFVWSEVNAANTGYEAGGYNNAWTVSQTASLPLVALLGQNEGLYYFRSTSIGLVRGAVTSTFSTSGTQDAVDETVGLIHPAALCDAGASIYFCDVRGRPWRLAGGQLEPIWGQMDLFASGAATTIKLGFNNAGELTLTPAPTLCEIALRDFTRHVLVRYPADGVSAVFAVDTGQLVGWEGANTNITRIGAGGATTFPRVVVALTTNRTAVAQGGAYLGPNGPLLFKDQFGTGATFTTYTTYILGQRLGANRGVREWHFDTADVLVEYADVTGYVFVVGFGYIDSNQVTTGLSATAQTSSITASTSAVIRTRHVRFGLGAVARWLAPRVSLTVSATSTPPAQSADRVGICGYRLKAFGATALAGVR